MDNKQLTIVMTYPRAKMMCGFTRPQRKADDPKARPTRNQLGLVGSGFELVKTDLDPADKTTLVLKNVLFECHIRFTSGFGNGINTYSLYVFDTFSLTTLLSNLKVFFITEDFYTITADRLQRELKR